MTQRRHVDRARLVEFLTRLGAKLSDAQPKPACRLYLIGETTQLFEGWREWTERMLCAVECAPGDRDLVDQILRQLQTEIEIEMLEEPPGQVIPLPREHAARARFVRQFSVLEVFHFDPYSVAFRLITRGDESDYRAVLAFLQHGWLTVDKLNELLIDLLPQFTRATIQQDPAEFRRKFRGLLQIWRAASPTSPALLNGDRAMIEHH